MRSYPADPENPHLRIEPTSHHASFTWQGASTQCRLWCTELTSRYWAELTNSAGPIMVRVDLTTSSLDRNSTVPLPSDWEGAPIINVSEAAFAIVESDPFHWLASELRAFLNRGHPIIIKSASGCAVGRAELNGNVLVRVDSDRE
jgi:hypothetical protein